MRVHSTLIMFFLVSFLLPGCKQGTDQMPESRKAQSIREAFEDNFIRTMDPALGYPPYEKMLQVIAETKRRQVAFEAGGRNTDLSNARWNERGPTNVGGRSRAILIDESDPERKTVFAGSVSGGIWKTENIDANPPRWQSINDYLENLAVGAIAQDPNDPDIMYLGTGEGFNNIDAVAGVGLFKSVDGGANWTFLTSTRSSVFRFTRAIVVHPSGDIYVATRSDGVQRSQDGGESWQRVLGITLVASSDNIYDLQYLRGTLYASDNTNIYKSTTGDRGDWTRITGFNSGFPNNLNRVEFSVCTNNEDIIYAVGAIGSVASDIFKTSNGGETWTTFTQLNDFVGGSFANNQAWYDLDISADPYDCDHVIAGGVPIYMSRTGAATWDQFAYNMHVDQHRIVFDEKIPGRVLFGNDGGIYQSYTGSATSVSSRNIGYITSQFYACAIHPDTFSYYFLGGTQDNGSLALREPGLSPARRVKGGDGMLCHIDQNEPEIQIVSSQFGNYDISYNGGSTFTAGASVEGGFINPSDYDNDANILYAQTNGADYYRWNINTNAQATVMVNDVPSHVPSVVYVDPNVENRVYFGTYQGSLIRVDDAHTGVEKTGTLLFDYNGVVSGIDVEQGNPDHILVTRSNFGIANNILESRDGGQTWIGVEGDLPDMPVRSVLFNPNDPTQAMIATEAGVWTTEKLDGDNTVWIPPVPGKGTPLVRTDMLQVRNSDYVVLAATHGRGLYTSDAFSVPQVNMVFDRVQYVDATVEFVGELSLKAESFFWEFGDGKTSEEMNPVHQFTQTGTFPVSLTINGSLTRTSTITIIDDATLPYVQGAEQWDGSFERNIPHYAVSTLSGSAWVRGNSDQIVKNGTRSGDYAFVTEPDTRFYKENSASYLYLPNFDFSDPGIYTFSFWTKYNLQPGQDGFNVEYSTDKGQSWDLLGTNNDPGWYNTTNSNLENSAFPSNTAYFSRDQLNFRRYALNVSSLSGNPDVAFRFQFRSESTGKHEGVVIDDVEVDRYDGELVTRIINFDGNYTGDKEITLNWSTRPEYHCRQFVVERSLNGRDFTEITQVNAKGVVTSQEQTYSEETSGALDLYFFRLKVINESAEIDYNLEFYSPTIIVRRNNDTQTTVHRVFPNPFTDQFTVNFNDFVEEPVSVALYDLSGRQVFSQEYTLADVFLTIGDVQLPAGMYYLTVQIGANEEEVFKVYGGF